MAWELLAIWAIVAATLIWFFRDEKRRSEARLMKAAELYATGAVWRHRSTVVHRSETAGTVPSNPHAIAEISHKLSREMRSRA